MEHLQLAEGRHALGVWLPIALAQIAATIRNALSGEGDPPARIGETLRSWLLPHLADAVERAERDADEKALVASFASLKARFGKSGNGNN